MATYNKIFFQSGPTGNVPGWGEFVAQANSQGIPVSAAVSDTTSLLDDMKTHGHKYKVANRGNFIPTGYIEADKMKKIDPNWQQAWGEYHLSVPIYDVYSSRDEAEKTYQRGAKLHLDVVETRLPAGLDREMVSVSTWNEIRPYKGWGSMAAPTTADWQKQTPGYAGWADAIGRQAYWIGKELVRRREAGEKWFRWAAFAFAGGNPEPGAWEAPGMLDYLRLAGQHPEVLGLALHEYCFTLDIWREFEQKNYIGRFEQLFAVCDKHQIPRPWVEIKEWGWKEDDIPDADEAMKQLTAVAKYYASFPQIKLAALWTANGGWRDASKKVPQLAKKIYSYTLATTFPDPAPVLMVKPPVDEAAAEGTADKETDSALAPPGVEALQLLQNEGFEEDWGVQKSHKALRIDEAGLHEVETGTIFTPPYWLVYYYHKEGQGAQPEVRDARDKERVFVGTKGQVFFTFNRRHHGGFLQTVTTTPGQLLTLTAVAHAWSNHKDEKEPKRFPHPDDPKWSDGVGYGGHFILAGETKPTDDDAVRNFTFRLGIDPLGGRDPRSDKVVWGPKAHIYNEYHAVPPVTTTATGSKATVFLESQTLWPMKHNDAYWDEVQLLQAAPQTDGDDRTTKQPSGGDGEVVAEEKVVLQQVLTAVGDPPHTLRLVVKKRDTPSWKTERTISIPMDADTQIELLYLQQTAETKTKPGTDKKGQEEQDKESRLGDLRTADTRKRLKGIDISEFQSPKAIDYQKLKEEEIAYAFVRACRGSSVAASNYWVQDTAYEKHFAELGQAGILRGSYHVLYEWEPEGQAQKFFAIYQQGELPPVLDIEKGQHTGELTAEIAQRFLKKWAALGGERPIIYTNQSTWSDMLGDPDWSTAYVLWVASYDAEDDNPYAVPTPWGKLGWRFWQHTDEGRLEAYDKGQSKIDLNWFKGDWEDLRRLGQADLKIPPDPIVVKPKPVRPEDQEEAISTEGILFEKDFGSPERVEQEDKSELINLIKEKIAGGLMLQMAFRSQNSAGALKFGGDCGPTCATMIVESVTGERVDPDDLMDQLGKTSVNPRENYTNFVHLTRVLGWYKIKGDYKTEVDLAQIEAYLTKGWPIISLIKYGVMEESAQVSSAFSGWHYILLIGFDETHLYFHDPLQLKQKVSKIDKKNYIKATEADKDIKTAHQILVVSSKGSPFIPNWVTNLPSGYSFIAAIADRAAKMVQPVGTLIEAWVHIGEATDPWLIRKETLVEVKTGSKNLRTQPREAENTLLNKIFPGHTMILTGKYKNGYAQVKLVLKLPLPVPEDKPILKGKQVDLLDYIRGDGRKYEVANAGGGQERFQMQGAGQKFRQMKNQQYESFFHDDNFIYRDVDTSPGGGRYYVLQDADLKAGSRWCPRRMAEGETYRRNPYVQFYNKKDGSKSSLNSGSAPSHIKFVKHHDAIKLRTNKTIRDVVELEWVESGEIYYYARGYGLVGWERRHQDPHTPQWSAISQEFGPGEREDMSPEAIRGL